MFLRYLNSADPYETTLRSKGPRPCQHKENPRPEPLPGNTKGKTGNGRQARQGKEKDKGTINSNKQTEQRSQIFWKLT